MYTTSITGCDPAITLHVLLSAPSPDRSQLNVQETKGTLSKYQSSQLVDRLLPSREKAKCKKEGVEFSAQMGLGYVLKHIKALNEQTTLCTLSTNSTHRQPLTSGKL